MNPRPAQVDLRQIHHLRDGMLTELGRIIFGSEQTVMLLLTALLTPRNSHVLLEDYPGVGKTTLLKAFAQGLGLQFSRIQGQTGQTPADMIGYPRPDPTSAQPRMIFFPGPLFGGVVLVDELNRITPRALSAVLEAMEEEQVTADGVTHVMPNPYFVVAAQNAVELDEGTFPLLPSVLDRFGVRLRQGYPSRENAQRMLAHRRAPLRDERDQPRLLLNGPLVSLEEVRHMREALASLPIAAGTVAYVEDLVEASRNTEGVFAGLSPRASLVLLEHAVAWAALHARANGPLLVEPRDVAAVWPAVAGHRLIIDETGSAVAALREQEPLGLNAPLGDLMAQAILARSGPPESWAHRHRSA
jgi:MoxR-like ATPase